MEDKLINCQELGNIIKDQDQDQEVILENQVQINNILEMIKKKEGQNQKNNKI